MSIHCTQLWSDYVPDYDLISAWFCVEPESELDGLYGLLPTQEIL